MLVRPDGRSPATLRRVTDYLVELDPANVVLVFDTPTDPPAGVPAEIRSRF